MSATYTAKIYPTTISPYFAQVYAGLFNLRKAGELEIEIAWTPPDVPVHGDFSLYIEVERANARTKRKILFDLADGGCLDAPEVVPMVDFVAKRSFSTKCLDISSDKGRKKIYPYGVNYSCSSRMIPIWTLFLRHHFMELRRDASRHLRRKFFLLHNARFLLAAIKNDYSLVEDEFRSDTPRAAIHDIFFITRLLRNHDNGQPLQPFAEKRIRLIKSLQKHFGSRFFGGIEDNALSRKHCPPEVLIPRMPRRSYIEHLRNSRIVIVTIGAHGSNPWKLGEALAASSCIVCEDLEFSLPVPLIDKKEYCRFKGEEECVAVCDELLSDSAKIDAIKRAAANYYENNVRSDGLVARIIRQAFGNNESVGMPSLVQ